MAADFPLVKTIHRAKLAIVEVENHFFCMGVRGKEWLFLNMNLMYSAELFLLDESRQDKLTHGEKWHAWGLDTWAYPEG